MSQKEKILDFFRSHGNKATLGQFLSDPSGIGYKCTSRFSELRKEGYAIVCEKGQKATDNCYRLIEFDQSGQGQLIQAGGRSA